MPPGPTPPEASGQTQNGFRKSAQHPSRSAPNRYGSTARGRKDRKGLCISDQDTKYRPNHTAMDSKHSQGSRQKYTVEPKGCQGYLLDRDAVKYGRIDATLSFITSCASRSLEFLKDKDSRTAQLKP